MAKNSGQHIKKKKRSPGARMIVVVGVVVALYFVGQAVSVLTDGVETVNATRVTVDDAVTVTGYFVRDEAVVAGTTGETVEHTVHSGEKVYTGARLAVEYTDESALETSRQVKLLTEQITLLQSAVTAASDLADTAKLDQLITMDMQAIAGKAKNGMVSGLEEETGDLRQLVLRRGAGGQDPAALQAQVDALAQQRERLQQSIVTRTKVISSPYDGFFSETVDGYENILKASELPDMTADAFAQKIASEPENPGTALGKVIEGFDWYFAALVPTSDAAGLRAGSRVSLRFTQVTEDVPASVYAARVSEDGTQTLLIFKSNRISSELVSMRRQVVDIIRASYTGIKVPKEAIRMEDGKLGVYTLSGSASMFREITPLYEGDTFYVIEQGSSNQTGIVVQDSIIIKGRALQDKKVVKK